MSSKCLQVAIAFLLMASGCASTGNPFTRQSPNFDTVPVDAIRAAAMEIESVVGQGDREKSIASVSGLNLDTPEIAQAIRTRAARAELVSDFLNTGFAYEQQSGLLSVVRNKEYKAATTSRDRDRYALIIMGENQNRWDIYEGIVEANDLGSRALSAIQSIFADVRIDQLSAGQPYESENGDIVRK